MSEIMLMMMSDNPDHISRNHHQIMSEDYQNHSFIINSTCPISWKLYHNPFFSPTNTSISNTNSCKLKPKQLQRKYSATAKFLHYSDLKMISNPDSYQIRTQVAELKAELEMERKQRKKMEALNKKLSKELVDQVERERVCVCEDLSKEVSRLKEEIEKMEKDMEEERKMLRMAEVLREERVQMKLNDAHLFYHQHFLDHQQHQKSNPICSEEEESKKLALSDHKDSTTAVSSSSNSYSGKNVNLQRKASPEAENPHIKQGIKGFVEFQRAIKAKNGCNYSGNYNGGGNKQTRDLGGFNKLECQKAQLKVLFKQKYPLPYSNHDHLILG
ncbi:Protein BRANCHLESS TRICHOME [Bienertia sinuspersici]